MIAVKYGQKYHKMKSMRRWYNIEGFCIFLLQLDFSVVVFRKVCKILLDSSPGELYNWSTVGILWNYFITHVKPNMANNVVLILYNHKTLKLSIKSEIVLLIIRHNLQPLDMAVLNPL